MILIDKHIDSNTIIFSNISKYVDGLQLLIIDTYVNDVHTIQLNNIVENNNRFTEFELTTENYTILSEGLFVYQLIQQNKIIESGKIKVIDSNIDNQSDNIVEYDNEQQDKYKVYEN